MSLNNALAELGEVLELGPLELDEIGTCAVKFDNRKMVMFEKAKDDESGLFYLYGIAGEYDDRMGAKALKMMLEANAFFQGTNGFTLCVGEMSNEVMLMQSMNVEKVTVEDLVDAIERLLPAMDFWLDRMDKMDMEESNVPKKKDFGDGDIDMSHAIKV